MVATAVVEGIQLTNRIHYERIELGGQLHRIVKHISHPGHHGLRVSIYKLPSPFPIDMQSW